jgi:hypothetical protein
MAVTERRRSGWGRVEVGELAPPERIDVPRFIPDNFVQAAKPPENNNLARLAEGLGHFNRGLQQFGGRLEADHTKRATEDALRRYNHWLSTTGSTEIVEAVREGRVHWSSDPYIGHIVRGHHGQRVAQLVATQIDQDPTFRDSVGRPDFDVEKYVLEKASPYAKEMSGDRHTAETFRKGLDAVRANVIKRHLDARGQIQTQMIEDAAMFEMDKTLDAARSAGMNGEQATEVLRSLYNDVGKRMNGGSLDLSYGKLDDLLINTLKYRAQDPSQAKFVLEVLRTERIDTGTGARIGSLGASKRHRDQVMSIFQTARNSLGKQAEEDFKASLINRNTDALVRGDGSFFGITDVEVVEEITGKTIKVSAATQREEATRRFIETAQKENGGKPDVIKELDVLVRNGVKHPTWGNELEGTFRGIANMNVSPDGKPIAPEQAKRIVEAANKFALLEDINPEYSADLISKDAATFYRRYKILVRDMGQTPEQAAATLASAYSQSSKRMRDPSVESRNRDEIALTVRNMGSSVIPFLGDVPENRFLVESKIIDMANMLMLGQHIDSKKAVTAAAVIFDKSHLMINGRAVQGAPGVQKEDAPLFQPIFKRVFEQNEAYLKSKGINSPKDLSVTFSGNGTFRITNKQGEMILVNKNADNPYAIVTPDDSFLMGESKKPASAAPPSSKGPGGVAVPDDTVLTGTARYVKPIELYNPIITTEIIGKLRDAAKKDRLQDQFDAIFGRSRDSTKRPSDRRRTLDPRVIREGQP